MKKHRFIFVALERLLVVLQNAHESKFIFVVESGGPLSKRGREREREKERERERVDF